MPIAQFTAPDIHCGKCAARVKDALSREPGVKTIDVDSLTHAVRVDFDEARTDRPRLAAALGAAGYPPSEG
jgi:Cd2+/Zn2+-exporting ATPase